MSDSDETGCDGLAEVAAELALGVLTGRERARALAHLDRCETCRDRVRQLTVTGEKLLELLPCHEPPPGFETRVLERLKATRPTSPAGSAAPAGPEGSTTRTRGVRRPSRAPRSRRLLTTAAGVAVAVGCGLTGWGLGAATAAPTTAGGATRSEVRTASLLTPDQHAVGTVFLHGDGTRWVYMTVDGETGDITVTCQVIKGGGAVTVGHFRLHGGYGYWGGPEPLPAATVTGIRLTSADDTVVATAHFGGGR